MTPLPIVAFFRGNRYTVIKVDGIDCSVGFTFEFQPFLVCQRNINMITKKTEFTSFGRDADSSFTGFGTTFSTAHYHFKSQQMLLPVTFDDKYDFAVTPL